MEGLRKDINSMVIRVGLNNLEITNMVIDELENMTQSFNECNFYYEIQMKIILHTRNIFRRGIKIVDNPDDILKISKLSTMIKKTLLNILSKSVA